MKQSYSITFNQTSTHLFYLNYEYFNEGPAVLDFQIHYSKFKDLNTEDKIRDLYKTFNGRHDSISNPIDLLGILLANGFSLCIQKESECISLSKDFFPISFIAKSNAKTIKIGDFYRTSTSSISEQFVSFSSWLDNLSGFSGMTRLMAHQFISSGYSITAYEPTGETVLVHVDREIVCGDNNVLVYLADE